MSSILSVSELTTAIKQQLESRFSVVTVRGEISNFKEQTSGHLYFTLKDADAQISAVLFKGNAKLLERLPKGGDQVVVKGEISVYAPRGNYQLIIRELQYQGTGQLLLQLHELKKKLHLRGWFDPAHKKKLPKYPKTLGVVTSPTGAVIQDILTVVSRRYSGIHVILNPVKVQGEEAAREIAQAIAQFNAYKLADVLIVGRGGGSLEDLFAFNEEVVAEAMFRSEIPIISAVGHETDVTIADFIADVRAPTPSAAAELAIGEKAQQLHFLKQTRQRLDFALRTLTAQHRTGLERLKKTPLLTSPYPLLGSYLQRTDGIRTEIDQKILQRVQVHRLKLEGLQKQTATLKPSAAIQALQHKLYSMKRTLQGSARTKMAALKEHFSKTVLDTQLLTSTQRILGEKKQRLDQLISHLRAVDPKNVLSKGYCILFQENKESVILSAKELTVSQSVSIKLHDGTALTTITEISHDRT
jgi:exodeoxyribonuclease VII large subunit